MDSIAAHKPITGHSPCHRAGHRRRQREECAVLARVALLDGVLESSLVPLDCVPTFTHHVVRRGDARRSGGRQLMDLVKCKQMPFCLQWLIREAHQFILWVWTARQGEQARKAMHVRQRRKKRQWG